MPTVTTRVLKDKLSSFLRKAEAGERFVVLRSGTPVAAIVPLEDLPEKHPGSVMCELARQGRVFLPTRHRQRRHSTPVILSEGPTASEIVIEDRR